MTIKELLIIDENGLHARPAALLSASASRYKSNEIYLLTEDNKKTDVKSIMQLLTNVIEVNQKIRIVVKGDNSELVANDLHCLLQKHKVVD